MLNFLKKKPQQHGIVSNVKCVAYKSPIAVKVGYTEVVLNFLDGRKFTTYVYGRMDQCVKVEHKNFTFNLEPSLKMYWVDGFITTPETVFSETAAQQFIQNCYGMSVFVDDPKFPYNSIEGKVIEATIGHTEEEYYEEFREAYLIEKELEL